MKISASANRRTALQVRERGSDRSAISARYQGRKDGYSSTPGDDEECEELEEIKLWPEQNEGQRICSDESEPGPP